MKTQIKSEDAPIYQITKPTIVDEDAIIEQAKLILEKRLTKFGISFTSPEISTDYLILHLSNLESERFDVLFLNTQNQLIKHETMFTGTIDGSAVYPREVAKLALQLNAAAVIFAHNHPSGVPAPSQADKQITQKLKECLNVFDIRVLDHIIVGGMNTYSFAERGLI